MTEQLTIYTEELRHIYKLILEGYNDIDILKEVFFIHNNLRDKDENPIELDIDISFIANKRKELKISSEVLKESIKKILNIYKQKQREDHYTQIKEISTILVENNINTITDYPNEAIEEARSDTSGPTLYTIKGMNYPVKLSQTELVSLFTKNVDKAIKKHGVSFFYDYYASHLQTIIGKEMETAGGFWPEVEKKPYKVIKAIKGIINNSGITGTCPLCNLEAHLPPFLRPIYGDIL